MALEHTASNITRDVGAQSRQGGIDAAVDIVEQATAVEMGPSSLVERGRGRNERSGDVDWALSCM